MKIGFNCPLSTIHYPLIFTLSGQKQPVREPPEVAIRRHLPAIAPHQLIRYNKNSLSKKMISMIGAHLPGLTLTPPFPGDCIHICYYYFNSYIQTCQDIVWIFNPINLDIEFQEGFHVIDW
jgi:hypothetical protein